MYCLFHDKCSFLFHLLLNKALNEEYERITPDASVNELGFRLALIIAKYATVLTLSVDSSSAIDG